ncbi:MAG: cytochrome c [Hyphomonadaceae bacterium]|nr:cytochrome c [Hyphomonadaceae bacterium]
MTSSHHTVAGGVFALFAAGMALSGCTAAGDLTGVDRPVSETAAVGWPGDKTGRLDPADVVRGRQIAERECAACHAIDRTSSSPKAGAPPLRDVLGLYEADNLAYRFIEGMRVGHDDMPLFDLDVRTADTLIAYIGTISDSSD